MKALLFTLLLLLTGCAATRDEARYYSSTAARYVGGSFSKRLTVLEEKIDGGDLAAWREFASYADKVDGESAETYAVACSELARRDPTFFLRRYLAGDAIALRGGREAFGWSGDRERRLLTAVYAERLYIASTRRERQKIRAFISATTEDR
jgi:hypothetical protein